MAVFLFLNLEEILVKTYLIDNDFQIKIFQMLFDSKIFMPFFTGIIEDIESIFREKSFNEIFPELLKCRNDLND